MILVFYLFSKRLLFDIALYFTGPYQRLPDCVITYYLVSLDDIIGSINSNSHSYSNASVSVAKYVYFSVQYNSSLWS